MKFINYLKSKKTYKQKSYAASSINRYINDILLLKNKNLHLEKGNPKTIVEKMKKFYTPATCKAKLTSVQIYMDFLGKPKKKKIYKEATHKLWKSIKKDSKKNPMTKSFNYGILKNILNKRVKNINNYLNNNVTPKQLKYIQRTLALGLYVLQPPRFLEFAEMEIVSQHYFDANNLKEKKKNYLIKAGSKWFFQYGYFKTFASYGIQNFPVSIKVKKFIDLCHAKMSKPILYNGVIHSITEPRKFKYLLSRILKGEMVEPKGYNGLCQVLRIITREDNLDNMLTTSGIRQSYIEYIKKQGVKFDLVEMIAMSNAEKQLYVI